MSITDYSNRKISDNCTLFIFSLFFSVFILSMAACQPLTKPLVDDDTQFKTSGALPQSDAKDIVSKYVGQNWAKNPYLMCQVNHLSPSDYRTTKSEYNVKGYISYHDMLLYPAIGRHECLNVRANQMDVLELENLKRTYYLQKSICCNIKEERDELVEALISLGARIGH